MTATWRCPSSLGAAALLGVALVGGAGCAPAAVPVPTVSLDAVRVPPPGSGVLARVAFLTGCWRTPADAQGPTLEERWTPPEGGMMLSTSRYLSAGRVLSFEFGLIRAAGETIVFLPHPGGQASEHAFVLTDSGPGEAVFEAPEHDYPKRIRYALGPEGLTARIDAGEGDAEPRSWRMDAVPCHGGSERESALTAR
ncbi:MAG: hypothetical protein KJP18_02035 [Gemmatimonadetes bacterium]|nr:hypothetical protein [Gemmatimonadota bacterium]NNF37839.1 hypothetical protein [Gemmatimonadota bacterium]NNK64036.1 hypothetical protein [Gemmatimonadota bacterium]